MSIPDLPTIPEVSGQTKSGIKYHILGTVQQTLAVELQPNQVVYSDAGAMSWMTSTVNMSTKAGGGLGGMLKREPYPLQGRSPRPCRTRGSGKVRTRKARVRRGQKEGRADIS